MERLKQGTLFDVPVDRPSVPEPHPRHPEGPRPIRRPWLDHINTCSSCSAPIRWATLPTGTRMPFDPEPVAAGKWVLEGPVAYHRGPEHHPATEFHQPHWASCDHPYRHRRR